MALNAVLFDLDSTLYPRSSGVQQAIDERINSYVQRVTGCAAEDAQALRKQWFVNYGTTLAGMQREYHVDVEDYLNAIHELRLDALLTPDTELDSLLNQLDMRRAIFTNSPAEHAGRVLRSLGIARHFPLIFDVRFLEFVPKPNLSAYTRALDALGVSAEETLLVEDTPQNIPPARRLGMRTILVDEHGAHRAGDLADHVVPNAHAAMRLLIEMQTP